MKMIKQITDPEAFQLLGDETRRRMIYLLRVKEMTVSQIAEQMQLTTQAIYHHIRKLKDVDMIEVAREERIGHFIETYYRTTAEIFQISHGEGSTQKDYEEMVKSCFEGLEKLGMKVNCPQARIKELVKLHKKMEECCTMKDWSDKISDLGLDFLTQQVVLEYASLVSMSEKQFDDTETDRKKLWLLLNSCVAAPKAAKKKKNVKKKK